jgi:cytoskeletal protein CcmA (bactofilin family)
MALKNFMAKADKPDRAEMAVEPPRPQLTTPPATRTVSPTTSIDSATEFEGTLRCKETLRIDGRIQGEVYCEKAVLVGEGARIDASIAGDEVQVAGGVKGNITARRKITLQRTAVVTGDLTTPGIVIEEGAKVKGRIVIGSDAEPAKEAKSALEAKDAKKADDVKKAEPSRKIAAPQTSPPGA